MKKIQSIIHLIDTAIKDDAENTISMWGIIKDNYNADVDHYRDIIKNSKKWLAEYQQGLIEETNITKLRIKYTNVAGYFIEVSKADYTKLGDKFIHKQTLVNAVRFITEELKSFESDVLEAESTLAGLEYEIFNNLREDILSEFTEIKELSKKSWYIDFWVALSQLAYSNNYCRPKIEDSYDFEIKWWRHAVLEEIEKDFISNDLSLNKAIFVHTITGPNMWWKSTFLRQNAIIILLAHIWSFVPAYKASIWLVDKLFSRVWATDNLYLGQSTFMMEMQEVANILNNSTKRSFVIIDEVWRWTSTFDGMSLAWAILKQNHDIIKAKTLFATHYHELIDESKILNGVKNFSVAVWENDENIIFLRKIIPWGMKKSYWLEVAKIAWVSNEVLSLARNMLLKLENANHTQLSLWFWKESENNSINEKKESEVEKEIEKLDINGITPIEALTILNNLKNKM